MLATSNIINADKADCEEANEKGNAAYIRGRYEESVDYYMHAISNSTEKQKISKYWSNCAQSRLQLRDYALAVECASKSIEFDQQNYKAHLRRSIASERLERFESALTDIEHVLQKMKVHPDTLKYCVQERQRLRRMVEKDKQAARREADGYGKLVHKDQALRLNFSTGFDHFKVNNWHHVSVYIANEFGLFRKSDFPSTDPIPLRISLMNYSSQQQASSTLELDPVDVVLHTNGKSSFRFKCDSNTVSMRVEMDPKYQIMGVVSIPMNQTRIDLGIHCLRVFSAPQDIEIVIAESPGQLGIGGKLWDSSIVLRDYLAKHPSIVQGKSVLELGSGVGYMGMCCARLGAHVTVTDLPQVVPLLQYNVDLNCLSHPLSEGSVQVKTHVWGEPLHDAGQYDLVLLCDVVYDPETYPALLASLRQVKGQDDDDDAAAAATILMGHRSRNPQEHMFFDALRSVEKIPLQHHDGVGCDVQIMYLRL